MRPDLSIIIPYYNRADTIQLVLESVERARADFRLEVILVDDGSQEPAEKILRTQPRQPDRIIRQENQGLLFARLAGLRHAQGEFTLFLDSDDLVGPEKFTLQLAALRQTGAAVSYTDTATAELHTPYGAITPVPTAEPAEATTDSGVFFIRVQPTPHSPIFRTDWLQGLVAAPLFPPSRCYNAVAEIWFYHIAAPFPVSVVKVPGAHTIVGHHPGPRLTNQWEKLGVASLGVMEAFLHACPRTEATRPVRQLLGEKAFISWRALPYDFVPEFDRRLLALWRGSPRGPRERLGGSRFVALARLFGPAAAGWLYRRLQNRPYAGCRAVQDETLVQQWLGELPSTTNPC